MSNDRLLARVRARVVLELEGLDPTHMSLRLDEHGDRSVFVVAALGDGEGSLMVARVYEADLHSNGALLNPVYLAREDAVLLADVLTPRGRGGEHADKEPLADAWMTSPRWTDER